MTNYNYQEEDFPVTIYAHTDFMPPYYLHYHNKYNDGIWKLSIHAQHTKKIHHIGEHSFNEVCPLAIVSRCEFSDGLVPVISHQDAESITIKLEEIDLSSTDYPVCPKCGHEDEDIFEVIHPYQSDGENICPVCDTRYEYEFEVSHIFSTSKIK